jgi:hypothetical protein
LMGESGLAHAHMAHAHMAHAHMAHAHMEHAHMAHAHIAMASWRPARCRCMEARGRLLGDRREAASRQLRVSRTLAA